MNKLSILAAGLGLLNLAFIAFEPSIAWHIEANQSVLPRAH
jgi:hypothetical protein